MKTKISLSILSLALLLSSCNPRQFGAVATGSSLGGMFGSSIGGLMGGWRGSNKGTLAGMVVGGAIGVAATTPRQEKTPVSDAPCPDCESDTYGDSRDSYDNIANHDEVQYGTYNHGEYRSQYAAVSDLEGLRVSNIHFLDANDNKCLDKDEEAYIVLDIKNHSGKTLYNVTPLITCNNRRVMISPAATISSLRPDKGVRYKAMLHSYRKLGKGPLEFKVEFSNSKQTVVAGSFTIRTR